MNLKKVLPKESILRSLKADTKQGVIQEMVAHLAAHGKIADSKAALQAILDRESKMSTGMQRGIAIPHGKTDTVSRLVVAIGIHQAGVDFEAMDHQLSHLFIMTLSPATRTGPHIQFLAEVSKVLNQPDLREKLMLASTVEEILNLLTS